MSAIEDQMEVYLSSTGRVCIAQRDMSEDCCFALSPEDVEVLIGLLKSKANEARTFQRQHPQEVAATSNE